MDVYRVREKSVSTQSKIAKGATAALVILWESGFFRSWRSRGAIDGQLGKMDHHFSGPELGMALRRAKHLTRRGQAGKYEYIQKYPYSVMESGKARKPKAK